MTIKTKMSAEGTIKAIRSESKHSSCACCDGPHICGIDWQLDKYHGLFAGHEVTKPDQLFRREIIDQRIEGNALALEGRRYRATIEVLPDLPKEWLDAHDRIAPFAHAMGWSLTEPLKDETPFWIVGNYWLEHDLDEGGKGSGQWAVGRTISFSGSRDEPPSADYQLNRMASSLPMALAEIMGLFLEDGQEESAMIASFGKEEDQS